MCIHCLCKFTITAAAIWLIHSIVCIEFCCIRFQFISKRSTPSVTYLLYLYWSASFQCAVSVNHYSLCNCVCLMSHSFNHCTCFFVFFYMLIILFICHHLSCLWLRHETVPLSGFWFPQAFGGHVRLTICEMPQAVLYY